MFPSLVFLPSPLEPSRLILAIVATVFGLAFMYARGRGVSQDHVQAYAWANTAAAQGVKDAPNTRDLAASKMTREEFAKAQKLSREYFDKYRAE